MRLAGLEPKSTLIKCKLLNHKYDRIARIDASAELRYVPGTRGHEFLSSAAYRFRVVGQIDPLPDFACGWKALRSRTVAVRDQNRFRKITTSLGLGWSAVSGVTPSVCKHPAVPRPS